MFCHFYCSLFYFSSSFPEGEVDYVKILNKVLPKDIRVMGWCPAPTGFSARSV